MTMAGENTKIQVTNLEEMKKKMLLCQQKINLFNLLVDFGHKDYDELIKMVLQISKQQNLKVCLKLLLNYDCYKYIIKILKCI